MMAVVHERLRAAAQRRTACPMLSSLVAALCLGLYLDAGFTRSETTGGVSPTSSGVASSLMVRFVYWDRADQQFSARLPVQLPPRHPADAGVKTWRWELEHDSPGDVTMIVTAQYLAPSILSLHMRPSQPADIGAVGACISVAHEERLFGLGERFGRLNLVGGVYRNWTEDQAPGGYDYTSYSPAPFLLSSQGYGLYLDTVADATFDLRTRDDGCYLIRVATRQLQAQLILGPHPQAVLMRHARLVGLPPLPPAWAFGVWKNLSGGQQRVAADMQRLLRDGVPVDAVWIYDAVNEQAHFGWPWQIYAPINPGPYPDLPGLIQRLHKAGVKVLGYVHPFVYPGSASFDEARDRDFLVQERHGGPYIEAWTFSPRAYLDFTHPQATAWWQNRVRFALTELGFDGAMLDFGEGAPVAGRYTNGLPGAYVHNCYPVLYVKAAYEVGQATKPGDFVFFARSGYSGSQPYTVGRFTGDQVRSWDDQDGLPAVVRAMLSGGLSGWPYWGPDIAGYYGPMQTQTNLSSQDQKRQRQVEKELWLRWVQVGALSPTMRDMHGSQQKLAVGLWTDRETLAVFRAYAWLHTTLKPYLYRYAWIAHWTGLPIVRPLFVNYPDEAETYTLDDQYLLGDDVLVAPVLKLGQTARRVYLPRGQWRDYWTDQVYDGQDWVTVAAPRHRIPLFLRQDAFVDLPPSDRLIEKAHKSFAYWSQ
jgi:alpha-glucosidase (family GH31 glycosyl hydrolase)